MAKRRKVLPARKPRDRARDDDSLLLQSAESLGRLIGALQRQLDSTTKRLSRRGLTAKTTKGATKRRSTSAKAASANDHKRRARARKASTKKAARPR